MCDFLVVSVFLMDVFDENTTTFAGWTGVYNVFVSLCVFVCIRKKLSSSVHV